MHPYPFNNQYYICLLILIFNNSWVFIFSRGEEFYFLLFSLPRRLKALKSFHVVPRGVAWLGAGAGVRSSPPELMCECCQPGRLRQALVAKIFFVLWYIPMADLIYSNPFSWPKVRLIEWHEASTTETFL